MTQVATKRGNPNFSKKSDNTPKPTRGHWRFKLIESFDNLKPVDRETNEKVDNPYPSIRIIPNAGSAVNPSTGQIEPWRYLHGHSSIWESEQVNPSPSAERLKNVDGKNDLVFVQGHMRIRENEKAKFDALTVQDIYKGVADQLVPVPFVYDLVDEDKDRLALRTAADEAFKAESLAREASHAEMVAVAMSLGIDINNEEDSERIRTAFIFKAKENPKLFLRVYEDPRSKIKYMITKYMRKGDIAVSEGKLTYNGGVIADVSMNSDISEQMATLAMGGHEKSRALYDTLKGLES